MNLLDMDKEMGAISKNTVMDKLNIKDLLSYSLESGASDLHLSVGSYPMVRINGEMKKLQLPVTDLKNMEAIRDSVLNKNQPAF